MAKIIKNGADFVQRANAHLIRKIDDIPELKVQLLELGDTKTHFQLCDYALKLAAHLLELGRIEVFEQYINCCDAIRRWQGGKTHYQTARDIAGEFNDLARVECDIVKCKIFRALGQVAATPHVKWHALVASEYAVVVVNLLYPHDLDKVRFEREYQIETIMNV